MSSPSLMFTSGILKICLVCF
ncbi:unnamed protein product [Linum tenue]|uniref:Uncharacterized protein n=1 Tax=Linum tenue TaxID=586396 RepID=A0AAV0RHR8_9ROSI|nr:unnamed protein product [Linum tenue]